MTKKPIIDSTQLLFMAVGSALVFPYTYMPILTTPPANQDVWVVLILSLVYIVAINTPLLFLVNRFRGQKANAVFETILGKFFGKMAALIYVAFFIYCYTACSLITVIFIRLYIFPETPGWSLLLYMAVPISYAAYKGAGVIGRLSVFLVPFLMLTILIFLALGMDHMDLHVLQPVLADSTLLDLNKGAFLTAARYSEILIFFMFSFFLKRKANINKTYAVSLGIFGISFLLILIPTITTLGVEYAKHAFNPYFVFTRQVNSYDFIERVQALNTLAWYPASLLKLIMYNFMGSFMLAEVVHAKSHKGFVIPISIIGFILCLFPALNKASTVALLRSDAVFPFVVLPVTVLLPLIMVMIYFLRRKKSS